MHHNTKAFQMLYDNLSKENKCISLKPSATELKKIPENLTIDAFLIDFTDVSKGDILYLCDGLNSKPYDKAPIIYSGSYFSHSVFTSKITKLRNTNFLSNSDINILQRDIMLTLCNLNIIESVNVTVNNPFNGPQSTTVNKSNSDSISNPVQNTKQEESAIPPKKPDILIVDDDITILTSVAKLLTPTYQVKAVKSASSAFLSIGKSKPDLILLDYMMPICNGKKTLEMLRDNFETKRIPVIMLTSFSERENVLQCHSLGISGYLVKPVNREDLLEAIESAIG